jgi:glycosyltransferase involved in cell wall biosynthesis
LRLLLFSQYFPPEVTAASARVHAFASGLAEFGHEVEVICEVPNHPTGVVAEGYRHRPLVRRRMDGFSVRYVWVRMPGSRSAAARVINYGSYAGMAAAAGAFSKRPDVVFASSPPLPGAAAAAAVARRHRVPWVFDVRDIWPEAAVAVGELGPGRALAAMERLERGLYADASAIVTVTEPFRRQIADQIAMPEKVTVIPNGASKIWIEAGSLEVERSDVGLPENGFVWSYCGNMGLAQGIDSAVEAAGILGDEFHLELVGAGPRLDSLRDLAAQTAGARVSFHGLVEPAEAARIARASDALLVPLTDRPEFEKFVPSKLFDFAALGRPLVVAAAGEPSRLTDEAGAGLSVPPGDPEAIAAAIRRLAGDASLRQRLGAAGQVFAQSNRRESGVSRLEALLAGLAKA